MKSINSFKRKPVEAPFIFSKEKFNLSFEINRPVFDINIF